MRRVSPMTICPRCAQTYSGPSARSRVDNKTEICGTCGTGEALEGMDKVLTMAFSEWASPPNEFDLDIQEMSAVAGPPKCAHPKWRWLDCDECRETIGVCGEKVCVDCGADID